MTTPIYARRAYCIQRLREAGLSDYVINQGMQRLPKYFLLGSKRAQYRVDEFEKAFKLTAPAGSVKS